MTFCTFFLSFLYNKQFHIGWLCFFSIYWLWNILTQIHSVHIIFYINYHGQQTTELCFPIIFCTSKKQLPGSHIKTNGTREMVHSAVGNSGIIVFSSAGNGASVCGRDWDPSSPPLKMVKQCPVVCCPCWSIAKIQSLEKKSLNIQLKTEFFKKLLWPKYWMDFAEINCKDVDSFEF